MKKKNIIIIIIVFLVLLIPIILNEISLRPKLSLIKDVEKILENIEGYSISKDIIEILINDGYKINNKHYNVKGKGVIFIEEKPSVMLSRNGMCAMKLPHSDDIMFQNEECPNYRLINGEKVVSKETK